MELAPATQIFAFALFAGIAVMGALGMATTMSMFRSGIFLMASFIGVGGLFILLMADLLGLLQIMMYIGGMLVMILFMVLFSQDPGGEMMAGMRKQGTMKMSSLEVLFSRGLPDGKGGQQQHASELNEDGGQQHSDTTDGTMKMDMDMDMSDMSMFTPIKKQAFLLALLTGVLLTVLIVARPAWPTVNQLPNQNSPAEVGMLLMGKYMIVFEGAGLLILLGIFASVMVSRPSEYPDPSDRALLRAAMEGNPVPIEADPVRPSLALDAGDEQT